MKKLMLKLRETRGDALNMQAIVSILVFCMCLALAISVLPLYSIKQSMDSSADQITRYIEIKGCINSDVSRYINDLRSKSNINFTCRINGNDITGTQKIQLEEEFEVYLEYQAKFGVGGILSIPVPIHSAQAGVSEKYYK